MSSACSDAVESRAQGPVGRSSDIKPVRVLHLLPDLQIGGGQKYVLDVIRRGNPDLVHAAVGYVRENVSMEPAFRSANVHTTCLKYQGAHTFPAALWRLLRLVRAEQTDVLHVHSSLDKQFGQLAALLTQTPLVSHLHIGHDYSRDKATVRTRFRARVRRYASVATVNRYIAVSKMVYRSHYDHIPDADKRLTLVYNGIPTEEYCRGGRQRTREELRSRLGIGPADQMILNVGRLCLQKDQTELIDAMSVLRDRAPNAKLVIAGEGRERPHLEGRISSLNLASRVRLLGSRGDVPDLLAAADVFALSSRDEGFGLVVAEAMAAAKPVVAYDLPVLRELITANVTGCLVLPRNHRALASALLDVISEPDRARELANAGRRTTLERFDIRHTVSALESIYLEARSERLGRPHVTRNAR